MGGAVFVRTLQLQHDLAGAITFEPFVGDGRPGDIAAELLEFCALIGAPAQGRREKICGRLSGIWGAVEPVDEAALVQLAKNARIDQIFDLDCSHLRVRSRKHASNVVESFN